MGFEIVNTYNRKDVWTRIAPHPQRLKDNLPQHWRFHVEAEPVIYLIDRFITEGQTSEKNGYSEDDRTSTTGMTAWIRSYGDVEISTDSQGLITAKVTLKTPPG